jgi:hypothetical protein
METRLKLEILPQPDDTTCGPTCLHALYQFHNDPLPLEQVIDETEELESRGTLAVLLACHALKRGYEAIIYTYNLQVFDPTWFAADPPPLAQRLQAQMAAKDSPGLHVATRGYIEFLRLGGLVRMEDLTSELIRRYLTRGIPILTGLSATFLYRDAREFGPNFDSDDVRGVPAGHFVVLCGYDRQSRNVLLADPLMPNPLASEHLYELDIDRVINAILLGILTHDANLLIIQPRAKKPQGRSRADRHRGQ